MSITSIGRYFVGDPNIVSIVTDNNLADITTAGYLTSSSIAADILRLNNGVFEWSDTDIVLINYAPNFIVNWFKYDADNATFVANPAAGGLSNTLLNSRIFVGNASNIATGVAMSGDATISNTGVVTTAPVGFSKLLPEVSAQLHVILSASDILGMYATPKLLVPAQGANTIVLVDDLTWSVFFTTTAFAAGGAILAQYGNAAHGAGPAASGSLAAATLNGVTSGNRYLANAGYDNVLNADESAVVNTAVYLSNQTAAFTTGDAAIILYVRYRILSIA